MVPYENTHRSTLTVVAASALITGPLVWIIATAIAHNETVSEYGTNPEALAAAVGWQGIGGGILAIGVLAFLMSLLAGSIGYDIRYSQAPSPEPTADEGSA